MFTNNTSRQFYNLHEFEFCHNIYTLIEKFLEKIAISNENSSSSTTVLLFPAANPRRRFLIHKCAELFAGSVFSVSVGKNSSRRVVIYQRGKSYKKDERKNLMSDAHHIMASGGSPR